MGLLKESITELARLGGGEVQLGSSVIHDEARNHCFAERRSSKEPWQPLEHPAHTAVMRRDCIFEDADTKSRLTHFGKLAPDGRSCTDGITTFQVGERTAYNPDLRQVDRGTQGTPRQHPPLEYETVPTGLQRLATALGRGVEAGLQENRVSEEEIKAQAATGDKKIDAALKKAEEMTPASLMNGVEAAEREAEADIRHAGADPKGTFNRALDSIKQGIESNLESAKAAVVDTAHRVKEGVKGAAEDAAAESRKPAIEVAEDLLKFGGRKAATAPREVTVNVATGVVFGGATKLAGGVLRETLNEGKAAKRLLGAVEKEAEAKHHHPELPPHRGNGGRGGGVNHAQVQTQLSKELGGLEEQVVELANGKKRIVDVTGPDLSLHQVGDMRSRGGTLRPSARERGAIEDLRKAHPDKDIIFHDKKGQHPPLVNPDQKPDWKPAPSRHRKDPD